MGWSDDDQENTLQALIYMCSWMIILVLAMVYGG